MKHRVLIGGSILAVCVLFAGVWLCVRGVARAEAPATEGQTPSPGPPPLVVDRNAPLLLDEPKEEPRDPWLPPEPKGADNGPCYVCHANYEQEPLAEVHRKANVGCEKCHGPSLAHRNDEDNVVPPEMMYWPERIDPACAECHPKHEASARDVLARWQKRCPEKTDPQSVVCTDCHGEHRLKLRTVWWDRKSGELVVRAEGERVKRRDESAQPPPEAASQ